MDAYYRVIAAVVSGILFIALGLISLLHNPHHRTNRSFSFFNFSLAVWNLSFVALWIPDLNTGFWLYRALHISEVLVTYHLIRFIQDIIDIYDTRSAGTIRQLSTVYALIMGPLYFTPFLISGYIGNRSFETPFHPKVTPLYIINLLIMAGAVIGSWKSMAQRMRTVGGLKRNQIIFAMIGLGSGCMAVLIFGATLLIRKFSWIHFPFEVLMSLVFAFAIYKYRLFDVSFILRRAIIYIGIYIPLLSIPFFWLVRREALLAHSQAVWWFMPALAIGYASMFSLAPWITNYLREATERKRFGDLKNQMEIIQETTQRLSHEKGRSLQEIAREVVTVFKKFYRDRPSNAVRFVLVYVVDQRGSAATACDPNLEIQSAIFDECMKHLRTLPRVYTKESFSRIDIEQEIISEKAEEVAAQLQSILNYLKENQIELCSPCVRDNKLYGVIFLGEKTHEHFWPEEITTLKAAASHVALAVHNAELSQTTMELRDLDRLKNDLISNITHEFNSPLAVVDNALELISSEVRKGNMTPERFMEYVAMIQKNTGRLGQFVQNLWEIQRIEQARVELNLAECDLSELARLCADQVTPMAEAKNVGVCVHSDGPILIVIDEDKIRQVVGNLITNAIKFTDQGNVDIHIQSQNGQAVVSVKDSGRGIDPKFLSLIFDRFFQVPEERRSARGMGLGLAIAKGWAEAHGGNMRAHSEGIGHGATFIMELPLEKNE